MRNRDPRFLLLLCSMIPFVLWIGGVVFIWQFWRQLWGPLIGVLLVWSGFAITKRQDRITSWIYRTHLRKALVDSASDQWIPVEMEKTGTQDKLHIFPDTVGILEKSVDGLILRELRGMEVHLARDQSLTRNVSKTNMTCSILFTDHHNNDVIGFVVTPRCIGAPLEVAAYGNSRYQWFLQWADLTGAQTSQPTGPPTTADS